MSEEGNKNQDTELAELKRQLTEMQAANEAAQARTAALERQLEDRQPQPAQFPTTAEGWNYALQVAQMRAEANEELRPYLANLYARFQEWQAQDSQTRQDRDRALGRVDAEMSRMGIKTDSEQAMLARRAIESGVPYDAVERAYFGPLKELKVKEADASAKDKQVKEANQNAIEGGKTRGELPDEGGQDDKGTAHEQMMSNLTEMLRSRAPSSVKLARGAAGAAE